jgi:hypothetical protein
LYGEIHGEVDEGKREKGRGFGILSLFIRLPDVALQLKNWKLLSFKHHIRSSWRTPASFLLDTPILRFSQWRMPYGATQSPCRKKQQP